MVTHELAGFRLAASGKRVLLMDIDLRKGHINQYVGLSRDNGMAELLAGERTLEQVVHRNILPNLDFIPTGVLPSAPHLLLMHGNLKQLMERVSAEYDLVLLDTPIFYVAGEVDLLPLTWAMLGTLVGFLFLNSRLFVKRAWVFMGDAGSMWLGLVLIWFMAQVTRGVVSAEPALVLWLFGIPLIDTLVVMMRRIKCKQSPFASDRTHIHHVLEHAGLSVRRTVLVLSLVQLILVGIGVIFYLTQVSAWIIFCSFVLLLVFYYYLSTMIGHGAKGKNIAELPMS